MFVGSEEQKFYLKKEICEFVTSKGKYFEQFNNPQWMSDFAYLSDINLHLDDLNLRLQYRYHCIN